MIEKYISIIWAIIKNPYEYFYLEMPKDDSVKEPLIFAIVILTISTTAYILTLTPFLSAAEIAAVIAASLILVPIIMFLYLYVSAFFVHGVIFMICPKRRNFKQTLKVLSYSNAANILTIIPFIGPFAAAIFNIRAWVFGLSAVHNVSALKIFMLFVIIPIILIAAFGILIATLFGAMILSVLYTILPSV